MLNLEKSESRRSIEVWVVLQLPPDLESLPKDITLSIHSLPNDLSAGVRGPWTNAIRMIGLEDIFVVRIKIPANVPCNLHAAVLLEEPPKFPSTPFRRRHIGMKNLSLEGTAVDGDVLLVVSRFETYTLYHSSFKNAA